MYFMLGKMPLEAVDLTGFDETQEATYAEHQVIKGKAKLQATGLALAKLSFTVRLHHAIGPVESRYQALLKLKDSLTAQALVWGRNQFKGYFVIESVASKTVFTDEHGAVLCRELTISLKECEMPEGAALPTPPAVGTLLPLTELPQTNPVKGMLESGKAAIKQGLETVRQVAGQLNKVREVVEDVRQLTQSPTRLGLLSQITEGLEGIVGQSAMLDSVKPIARALGQSAEIAQEIGGFKRDLNSAYQAFKSGAEERPRLYDWFAKGSEALSAAEGAVGRIIHTTAPAAQQLMLRTPLKTQEQAHA